LTQHKCCVNSKNEVFSPRLQISIGDLGAKNLLACLLAEQVAKLLNYSMEDVASHARP
jgi:hypothetical protein